MYITEIDLGGHGECVECNLWPYRFEKLSKKQLWTVTRIRPPFETGG